LNDCQAVLCGCCFFSAGDCQRLHQIAADLQRIRLQHCPTVLTEDVNTLESRCEVLNIETGSRLVLLVISVTLTLFAYFPPRFNDFWPLLFLTQKTLEKEEECDTVVMFHFNLKCRSTRSRCITSSGKNCQAIRRRSTRVKIQLLPIVCL
jgi:hypothetical protein